MPALRPLFLVPSILFFSTLSRAAPPDGSLRVGVRGAYAVTLDGRREILGLVSLTIPLDRMAAPRLHIAQEPAKPPAPSTRPLLDSRFVNAALRAAYRRAGRAAAHARLAGLSSRARASAALPELRLRAARSTDESLRLTPSSSDPYRYTQAGGVTLSFEGQATWRLDRLVFADEEIQVEHLVRNRAKADSVLTEQVLRALFAWQRARITMEREDLDPDTRLEARFRALEAALRLDVLTGGWFSRHTEG